MDRDDETTRMYAATLCSVCAKDNLRHLDSSAVAKIVEHSSRLAEDQGKLSTRFAVIAVIIREANYWAGKDGSGVVSEKHVDQAIVKKVYRVRMIEEKIQDMIDEGTILIDSDGAVVGQVNGLAVYSLGDHACRPSPAVS